MSRTSLCFPLHDQRCRGAQARHRRAGLAQPCGEQPDGQQQPGREAAAGFVVAAHEEIDRNQRGKRQHQPHQHGGHHEVAHGGVGSLAWVGEVGVHIGGQCALLGRQVHHLARGAEAPQQRIHRERDDARARQEAARQERGARHRHLGDHVADAACGARIVETGSTTLQTFRLSDGGTAVPMAPHCILDLEGFAPIKEGRWY